MKKRLLAMALALALAVGLVPVTAGAVDTSYKTWAQYDGRWGSMSISSNGSGNNSMARVGCYVTAIAKLLVHANQQDPARFTPKECLEGMLAHGMLSTDGGVYYGNFNNSFLPTYGPELTKETSSSHSEWDRSTAINVIGGKIREGYYVIVCVINGATGNTHYMTVDYVSDDIYVMDNEGIYGVYGSGRYSGVRDQVYFKYSGSLKYPAYENQGPIDTSSTPATGGETKTQYRYHRYEDGYGEFAVCAYYGNSLSTAAGPMHVRYTDWLDSPLPVITGGPSYLVHPFQGASCINAGCVERADSTTVRYRDSAGNTWYYEETRTVAVDKPAPQPDCEAGHTWGEWTTVTEAACEDAGERARDCAVCGERETEAVPALGHDYQVKQETGTATLYVCTRCGDSYMEEAPEESGGQGGMKNFVENALYRAGLFTDVTAGEWFEPNVRTACDLRLMKGTGDGRFTPRGNVTLAEVVTMAARIHSIYHTGSEQFPAYDGGNWYDPYVNYARDKGIIYENYAFGRPATREEFVHILAAALPGTELGSVGAKVPFADSGDIVYIGDVELLSGAGVINGIQENGQTYFKPSATITRAEAAAIITRMAKPALRKG